MRCLVPTGISVAEGWRETASPISRNSSQPFVSRQEDIFICLYAVKQCTAAQCLSEPFLMPAPEQGGVTPEFRAELPVMVPAQQTAPASHPTLLCPPCTVPARQSGQPAAARAMRSVPLFIPGAMGSPGEQGRAQGLTRGGASCASPGFGQERRRGAGTGLRGGAQGGGQGPGRAAGIVRAARPPRRYPHPPRLLPHESARCRAAPRPPAPSLLSVPRPPLPVRLAAPTPSAASFPALRFFCSDSQWLRGPVCCPVNK